MAKKNKGEMRPEKAEDDPGEKKKEEGKVEEKEEEAEEEAKEEKKDEAPAPQPAPKNRGRGKAIAAVLVTIILIISAIGIYWFFYMQPANKAPDFTLKDTDGNEFSLRQFEGKRVVVLDFMFTTCESCKVVEKNLRLLFDKYNGTGKVEIISISTAFGIDNTARLAQYKAGELGEAAVPWRMAMDDSNDPVQTKYGVTSPPMIVVIDMNGYAIYKNTGITTYDKMKRSVDDAIAGKGARVSIIELSIYGIAILTGIASFFSPCAFPMLPGYMTYYLQKRVESQKKAEGGKGKGKGKDGKGEQEAEPENDKATVMKAAKSGSVTAAGLLVVYFVTGALVVFVGSGVSNKIGYMQLVVGIILIVLGGLMFSNLQYYRLVVPIQNAFARMRRGGGTGSGEESGYYGGLFAYGAGYGAAAAGCTLPAFVAVIFGAMVSGSILMGLIVVFLYSIVAAMLMIGVTVGIAYFGQGAVQKLAAHTETIKKVSAAVLILVGVYLILFFLDSKGYISIFGNLGI